MAEPGFHPAALREYLAAVDWYRQRNRGAAVRFAAEVDRIQLRIGVQPDRYGWYDDDFREAGLLHFPYSVVYRVGPSGDALIVAVAHASREPGYWQDRL